MPNYPDYRCKKFNIFFLLCHKSKKYENAQEWMRAYHIPEKGLNNLKAMYSSLGSNHLQINSITIAPETQNKQKFGIADIVELDQDKEDDDTDAEINEEANINAIAVNKIPIGKACSPYEVIQA